MTSLAPRRDPLVLSPVAGGRAPRWHEFCDPVEVLQADAVDQVAAVLERAEAATAAGHYAAGFVTYEAAPAFDPALVTHPPGGLPLAWFGVFRRRRLLDRLPPAPPLPELAAWTSTVDLATYVSLVDRCRAAIAAGDTYQVNLTFRLLAPFTGDPWALFARLLDDPPRGHAAFLDLGDHVVCSASPELFFSLAGSRLRCRPMKGTAPRGLTAVDDDRLALALYDSPKDRAENLMIVDMVRNDLGRLARPGTVRVSELFALETYESVHQLTSVVEAETEADIAEIFGALFPSASITGAPKVRTMQLLEELETSPRGIYTGAIGHLGPERRAVFNVAIRTVHVDRTRATATYGTGGGIVWDSDPESEFRESAIKALILHRERPAFELLETLRWEPGSGYFLLARHLDRVTASARYFGFAADRRRCREALDAAAAAFGRKPRRVRLTLDRTGTPRVESFELDAPRRPWALAIAETPVDAANRFLYHKTTHRRLYERARAEAPGYDDVLLSNRAGKLTESTVANLALRVAGRLVTPPLEDGLLPGTFRDELLGGGELESGSLTAEDLGRAEEVRLFNSVRGWIEVGRVDRMLDGKTETLWRNSSPPPA